jgi:hypothetical protein
MKVKKVLVVGGLVVALGIPGGVALATTLDATPSPGPGAGQGFGPGQGRMGAGYGDPEDCPFHDTAEAQQWRDQREERQQLPVQERQKLVQQHRQQMWEHMGATGRTS